MTTGKHALPPRLSPEDPALVALNQIAQILGPLSREKQLRTLASACVAIGEDDHAQRFLAILRNDVIRARERGSE